jgi:hypothetical protein
MVFVLCFKHNVLHTLGSDNFKLLCLLSSFCWFFARCLIKLLPMKSRLEFDLIPSQPTNWICVLKMHQIFNLHYYAEGKSGSSWPVILVAAGETASAKKASSDATHSPAIGRKLGQYTNAWFTRFFTTSHDTGFSCYGSNCRCLASEFWPHSTGSTWQNVLMWFSRLL